MLRAATPHPLGRRCANSTVGTHHASRAPAEQDAESLDVDHCEEQTQSQDKNGRATQGADLPSATRDLPDARDVLPNTRLAEFDERKVAETRDTEYGLSHRVLSGLTGPNGRHATLVTCWLIEDRAGLSVPRLTTAWVQPHRDKETER